MKKFWAKQTELSKMIFLAFCIGIIFALLSLIGLIFGQVGWLIGVALGTLSELVSLFLHYRGTEIMLKDNKAGIYIVFFVIRTLLLVGVLLLCVLFDKLLHIAAFTNSVWGCLIGLLPLPFVTVIGTMNKKDTKEVK